MSDFDWGRKGPPRPGSSSMDHPRGIERPWVTPQERAKKAAERENDEKIRKARAKLFADAVRLEPFGVELEQRVERGESLSFWDQASLNRWRKIRGVFEGDIPTTE